MPAWVLASSYAGLLYDFDFENGRYWLPDIGEFQDPSSVMSEARSSNGWHALASGLYAQVPGYAPRIADGLGLLVEPTRTNLVRQCRNLAASPWTWNNAVAALDQVGIDGVGNAASSVTAAGPGATAFQSIASASSVRIVSAFVRRVSGAGAVSMTLDAGATWSPVVVTENWSRFTLPVQIVANPAIGIRIDVEGDAVAIDFIQCETDAQRPVASSPILTTTAVATRMGDNPTIVQHIDALASTASLFVDATPIAPVSEATGGVFSIIDDGTRENAIRQTRDAAGRARLISRVGDVDNAIGTSAWLALSRVKFACAVDGMAGAVSFDGGSVEASSTHALAPGLNTVRFGCNGAGWNQLFGYMHRSAAWNIRLSDGRLRELSG